MFFCTLTVLYIHTDNYFKMYLLYDLFNFIHFPRQLDYYKVQGRIYIYFLIGKKIIQGSEAV